MDQDRNHLQLLTVFHYVVGGLTALVFLFPLLHLAMGLGLATGAFGETDPQARLIGCLLAAVAGMFILAGLTLAACIVAAGRCLARRRRYMFCLVVAGVSCGLMPFGTVLGVFTILVLQRQSVRALFGVGDPVGSAES
jgi:hypothetical protein